MSAEKGLFIQTSNNTVNVNISGDKERIRKFSYRNNMLNDNFYAQVELELGNVYSKSKELGLISQIDDTNNLFRMVVEEISKVYDNGVSREFDENESIQEDMELLYDSINANEILKQSNIYMNAFNDCLIQVGVKDDNFTLKLRRPDNTIVKTDDDLNLIEVFVYVGEENKMQKWYGYTDTQMFKILVATPDDITNETYTIMPMDGEDETVNNLGFLPFVQIHNGFRDGEFWQNYKGDDLVKGTIQVAIKLTFLNHLIKMQSFKQLVASGSNLRQLNGAVLDPQTILFVEGEDTKVEVLDLESNYKSLWETIQSINNNIALNYKISPNTFRMTGTPTSGFSLLMENIKLDKFIKSQQNRYEKIEKRLFSMLKSIDDKLSLGLIKSDGVTVSFPKISYPTTEIEDLEKLAKEVELGKNSIPFVLSVEQDIFEADAVRQYEENIKQRNKLNEKLTVVEPKVNLPITDEN